MDQINDWRDIRYLLRGDEKQKEVYAAIHSNRSMEFLSAFTPTLTGTYPIGIYLPGSDIDIICQYDRADFFENVVLNAFKHHDGFGINKKVIRGEESIIARFYYGGFLFEIFGQNKAVDEQYAYRHMLVEHRLLSENDAAFRLRVIDLKEKGLSTEEAFCQILGIDGDPYVELLKLET